MGKDKKGWIMEHEYLARNLESIQNGIKEACARSGRDPKEITLVAVTKTFGMDLVNASLELGITDVAENKVQEIETKYPQLGKAVQKHMIGHLQTNKVKKLIGKVDLIQSVDSIRLLDEIEKQSDKQGALTRVLLQVNIGEEEQKSGFEEGELDRALQHASKLEHVKVCGFMAMAPFLEDPEETRIYFRKMKKIFERYSNLSYNEKIDISVLSMGMSGDFEVAIEEGATMIRVGSSLYGARDYGKKEDPDEQV